MFFFLSKGEEPKIIVFSGTCRQIDSILRKMTEKKPEAVSFGFESTPKEEGGGDNRSIASALLNINNQLNKV
ncbi:MAG: hypothetical protein HYS18_09600 [Burkholderiales bacterium]|nr:hypothetical protein [Burkholderiales bacterium]